MKHKQLKKSHKGLLILVAIGIVLFTVLLATQTQSPAPIHQSTPTPTTGILPTVVMQQAHFSNKFMSFSYPSTASNVTSTSQSTVFTAIYEASSPNTMWEINVSSTPTTLTWNQLQSNLQGKFDGNSFAYANDKTVMVGTEKAESYNQIDPAGNKHTFLTMIHQGMQYTIDISVPKNSSATVASTNTAYQMILSSFTFLK